jgi:hypothetical protein
VQPSAAKTAIRLAPLEPNINISEVLTLAKVSPVRPDRTRLHCLSPSPSKNRSPTPSSSKSSLKSRTKGPDTTADQTQAFVAKSTNLILN